MALAVAVVAAGYGSGTGEDTGASSGVATRTPPTPVDTRGLLTGLAEANPHLIAPAARPPAGFEVARDRVAALRPEFFRLLVDWSKLQPSAGAAPDLAAPVDGCARGRAPCAASDGLREQLRAVKARQEADGGWRVVVTLYGTPAWAAAPAAACEREGTEPRSRMPDLRAYRGLVRALQDLARAEGVELELWSPWNEPNHPYFLSPQRARCAGDAPPLAPARYARLVRAMAAELRPGQQLVLGELAGYDRPQATAASVEEFIAALPRDVACAPGPWAQHTYVGERGRDGRAAFASDLAEAGNGELLDAVDGALRARGCPKPIWITETGTFARDCASADAALRAWANDPRVEAAFQYTFREDPEFPVGLADAELKAPYGAYEAWRAWGRAGTPPDDPCA